MVELKDVVGYEDRYIISSGGEVYRKTRSYCDKAGKKYMIRKKKQKSIINSNGYRVSSLTRENIEKIVGIHRLVYEAYVGEIPAGMYVCHFDGNRENNEFFNLGLSDARETVHNNYRFGKQKLKFDRETVESAISMYKTTDATLKEVAENYNMSVSTVSSYVRGVRRSEDW